MSPRIRSPKDFWAGVLYAASAWLPSSWRATTAWAPASRMGPAYFPTALGSLLLLIGIASIVRSFLP